MMTFFSAQEEPVQDRCAEEVVVVKEEKEEEKEEKVEKVKKSQRSLLSYFIQLGGGRVPGGVCLDQVYTEPSRPLFLESVVANRFGTY